MGGDSVAWAIWTWIVERIVPPLAIAGAAAVVTLALTVRDTSRSVVDLRGATDKLAERVERDNLTRAGECAAVQARVFAVESRLGVEETRGMAHESEANEWKSRIKDCEQQQRKASSDPSARPDHFTGTQGRELDARIRALEEYRAVDTHRMERIEASVVIGNR